MRHLAACSVVMVLSIFLGPSKVLSQDDAKMLILEQPSDATSWSSWSRTDKDGASLNNARSPKLDNGEIVIEPGAGLLSAPFPVQAFHYYQIDFDARAEGRPLIRILYTDATGKDLPDHSTGMDRSGIFKAQTSFSRAKMDACHARILIQAHQQPVVLRSLQVHPAGNDAVNTWANEEYPALPDLPDRLFATDHSEVARSVRGRLISSKHFRIVLLGDSIMNDTGNSPMDVLISKHYPGLYLEIVTSVENAKGSSFYKEEGRVARYVTSKRPDLVLIGGISHGDDIESLAYVVDQIQSQLSCPILLLSGAVGPNGDPRLWSEPPEAGEIPPATEWAKKVCELATTQGVGFFDIEQAWGTAIMRGIPPYEDYLRDPIHANSRGQLVLARLLERFFSQTEKSPTHSSGSKKNPPLSLPSALRNYPKSLSLFSAPTGHAIW